MLFGLCVYAAVALNMKGASNIVIAFSWFQFVISLFIFNDVAIGEFVKTGGRAIPASVDVTYDTAITLVLLWNDYIASGIVYFIGMLLLNAGWQRAERIIKETKNENH